MTSLIEKIPRLGVRKQFPTIKNYLKSMSSEPIVYWQTEILLNLQKFIKDGAFATGRTTGEPVLDTYGAIAATGELSQLAIVYLRSTIQSALKLEDHWLKTWHRAYGYQYWALRADYIGVHDRLARFQRGEIKQFNSMIFIDREIDTVATCLVLGWTDWGLELAREVEWAISHGYAGDGGDDFGRRRTQHFVMRLIANWQGWPERDTPKCAFDEPLFNALIEHWRTEDMALIQHLLLAACDRRTHQSRYDKHNDSGGTFYDLPLDQLWYNPFEILLVLRLRQTLGLPNPELDHPLMNTLLGQLPEITAPYSDDLLEGVIARACLTYPELCQGTSIQPSSLPISEKPTSISWIKKLFK